MVVCLKRENPSQVPNFSPPWRFHYRQRMYDGAVQQSASRADQNRLFGRALGNFDFRDHGGLSLLTSNIHVRLRSQWRRIWGRLVHVWTRILVYAMWDGAVLCCQRFYRTRRVCVLRGWKVLPGHRWRHVGRVHVLPVWHVQLDRRCHRLPELRTGTAVSDRQDGMCHSWGTARLQRDSARQCVMCTHRL